MPDALAGTITPDGSLDDVINALIDGGEIHFYAPHHSRRAPAPFTLRCEDGRFKVRDSRGQHAGHLPGSMRLGRRR